MRDEHGRPFQKALVTGASSGIGAALAVQLAERGVALILTGRNRDRLEALAEQLRTRVSVDILLLDLTQRNDRAQLVSVIHRLVPDLIINNAGVGLYGEVLSYETAEQLEILELNATALLEITLEGARALVSRARHGVIMNISSVAAVPVFPLFSVYSATKAFVNQLSESLDFELRPRGVRVLASCPGYVNTRFQERASSHSPSANKRKAAMTVEFAAGEILRQVDSGVRLHAFDWRYRMIAFFCRYLIPKRWVAASVMRSLRQRAGDRPLILTSNREIS